MTARMISTAMIATMACFANSGWAQRPTVYNGVQYHELTDLGAPRIMAGRSQNGAPLGVGGQAVAARPSVPSVRGYAPGFSPYAPADQAPSLTSFAPAVQQPNRLPYQGHYAYGYGYTPVGCNWAQPTPGYNNTMPAVNYQPLVGGPPAGGGFMPFNPYAQQQSQPFWRPLVPIKGMPANYQIGQGLIGQPKIYVPNQPVRNFLRYITP